MPDAVYAGMIELVMRDLTRWEGNEAFARQVIFARIDDLCFEVEKLRLEVTQMGQKIKMAKTPDPRQKPKVMELKEVPLAQAKERFCKVCGWFALL